MAYLDRSINVAGRTSRALPVPRGWPITSAEILAVLVANALLIVAMWVRHGGLAQLDSAAGIATGAGQLTALLGTYLALVQLVLERGHRPHLGCHVHQRRVRPVPPVRPGCGRSVAGP